MKYRDKLILPEYSIHIRYEVKAYSSITKKALNSKIASRTFDSAVNKYKRSKCFRSNHNIELVVVYINDTRRYRADNIYDEVYDFERIKDETFFSAREKICNDFTFRRLILLSPDCEEVYGEVFDYAHNTFHYDFGIMFEDIRLDTSKKYISNFYAGMPEYMVYEYSKLCPCTIFFDGRGFNGEDKIIGSFNNDIIVAYMYSLCRDSWEENAYYDNLFPTIFIPAKLFKEYNPQE